MLVATVYMFVEIPKGFIPDQDTDQIQVITEAAQGTSFYQMVGVSAADRRGVPRRIPNVEALMSSVGGTPAATLGGPNFGQLVVHLKPRAERKLLVERRHRGTAAQARRHSPA